MRKFLNYIILFSISLSLPSCMKTVDDSEDVLSGSYEQAGTVSYIDSLRSTGEKKLLPNQLIKIGFTTKITAGEYIYSVSANANSEFNFTNLSAKDYTILAETTVNGLDLKGIKGFVPGNSPVELILYPDTTIDNLILITARDKATNGRLNNAKVCVFSSRLLANSNNCDGSFISGVTDNYGKYLLKGLSPGKYYINTELVTGNVNIRIKDSVDVLRTTGLFTKEVFLQ